MSISEKLKKEYKKLNEDFVRENIANFSVEDWKFISQKISLSENFLLDFKEHLDWKKVFQYQYFTEEFISKKKYNGRINWKLIFKNKTLDESLIERFWKIEDKYPSIDKDVYYYRQFSIEFLQKYASKSDILYQYTTQKLTEEFILENYWLIVSCCSKESSSYGSKAINENWAEFRAKQKHLSNKFFAQFKYHNREEAYTNITIGAIEKVGENKVDWDRVQRYCKNNELLQRYQNHIKPYIEKEKEYQVKRKKEKIKEDERYENFHKILKPERDVALEKFKNIGADFSANKIIYRNDGLNILFINYDSRDFGENNIGFSLQVQYISRIVSVSHFSNYSPMAAHSNLPNLAPIYTFEFPFVEFKNKTQISEIINNYVDSAIYYISYVDAIINKHSWKGIMDLMVGFNEKLSAPQIYAMAVMYGIQNEVQKGIKTLENYLQNELKNYGKISKTEENIFLFLIKQLKEKTNEEFLEYVKENINTNHLDKSYTHYEQNFNPKMEQKTLNMIQDIGDIKKPQNLITISFFEEKIKIINEK